MNEEMLKHLWHESCVGKTQILKVSDGEKYKTKDINSARNSNRILHELEGKNGNN